MTTSTRTWRATYPRDLQAGDVVFLSAETRLGSRRAEWRTVESVERVDSNHHRIRFAGGWEDVSSNTKLRKRAER